MSQVGEPIPAHGFHPCFEAFDIFFQTCTWSPTDTWQDGLRSEGKEKDLGSLTSRPWPAAINPAPLMHYVKPRHTADGNFFRIRNACFDLKLALAFVVDKYSSTCEWTSTLFVYHPGEIDSPGAFEIFLVHGNKRYIQVLQGGGELALCIVPEICRYHRVKPDVPMELNPHPH